jgi:predicted Zn-dependent protease with MMP-like domain
MTGASRVAYFATLLDSAPSGLRRMRTNPLDSCTESHHESRGRYILEQMKWRLAEAGERVEEYVQDALDSLPPDLRSRMSNVEIVIEDEPPPGESLLGLYQGVPLTRRGSYYGGVLPDKITIYRVPLVHLYGHDPETLRRETGRVVVHEVAHHFGISDERLIEIDCY